MNSHLELGHLSELAWEASRTFSAPRAIDRLAEPSSTLSQLADQVDVLELIKEVRVGHPEDSIHLLVGGVLELVLSLGGPLLGVISPVAVPLGGKVRLAMRVPHHHELLAHVVLDVEDCVSVTLNDTFLTNGSIPMLVLGATSSHKSFVLVHLAENALEDLNTALVSFKSKLFREAILNEIGKSKMNLACLDSLVRTVKLGVGFLENSRPHFATISTTSGEGRLVFIVHGNPVIDDNELEVAVTEELEHEAASLLPVVGVILIGVVTVILADKELNSALVAKHRKGRKEVAISKSTLGDVFVRSSVPEKDSAWDLTSTLPACNCTSRLLRGNVLSENSFLIVVVKLNIVEFLSGRGSLHTNLLQFHVAIGHFVNRHVWVGHKTRHRFFPGFTHLSVSILSGSRLGLFSLCGKLLIDLLLALFLDKHEFE